MRITIFTAGSRGDVQPCVAIGKGLTQAGYQVTLAAPENFAQFVHDHGLHFHPLRGDVQAIMASDAGKEVMESGNSNPLKAMRSMRSLLGPVALQMAEDALAACVNTDALLSLGVFAPFGKTIAEIHSLPLIYVEPTPLLPTAAFPAAGWPIQKNLGGIHNRLSGMAMLFVIWQWYRPFVNSFRQDHGLQPLTAASFRRTLSNSPLLGAYSSAVIPRPPDWPSGAQITGYCFLDASSEWTPPAGLEEFLQKGEPPVYFGFGSMSGKDAEQFTRIILSALDQTRHRGILLTGWGGMESLSVPENVFVLDSAPHNWLFPRMAALVHHGGAGTTAEGLRAGVPTVTVAFNFDQTFWGKRMHDLGVGTEPIQRKNLNADNLAHAVNTACTDPEMKRLTNVLGNTLRHEQGVHNAVAIINRYLEV